MSLPREILEQLLSGYLDDALSADERARVERLVETDAEAASQLEELRELRMALKEVSRADAGFKLPDGFADRVLDASVAAAASEGLGDDHPLVRLAEQPSAGRKSNSRTTDLRFAGVLVALAASIVFAVIAFRPSTPEGPGTTEIASTDQGDVDPSVDPVTEPDPITSPEEMTGPADGGDMIAAKDNPPVTDSDPANPGSLEPVASPNIKIDPNPDAIASSNTDVHPDVVSHTDAPLIDLVEIMVLDLKQTAVGRESDSVRAAMRSPGLDAATEKKISEEIVKVAVNAAKAKQDDEVVILYLQASAKSIDRFISTLVADEKGIESVRLALAEDAPTLRIAQAATPIDPTKVQHAGTWQLASEADGLMGTIAHNLQDRTGFLTIDAVTAQAGAATVVAGQGKAAETNGPDFISQILVLIR